MMIDMPVLDKKIEVSVNCVYIQELLRGIGVSNKLNIIVDQNINVNVISNFSDVKVKDLLMFLCKKYDLDIVFTANIISVIKYTAPIIDKPTQKIKNSKIDYNSKNNTITLDIKDDSLYYVAKEITKSTGKNVICMPEIKDKTINVYFMDMPFNSAMMKLALINGVSLKKNDDSTYIFEKSEPKTATDETEDNQKKSNNQNGQKKYGNGSQQKKNNKTNSNSNNFEYEAENINKLSISAQNVPIIDIIRNLSSDLNVNYCIYSEIKDNISLSIENVSYEELLKTIFNGTKYTYEKENNIFLLGERMQESIRKTKVLQLQYRTVVDISKNIPQDLKKDVEIKEYPELNSLIISGSAPVIKELETFIRDIDKSVPVINIEVMVIDYKTGYSISTGVKAGVGTKPAENNFTFLPNLQMDLNSTTLNNIINSINGWGVVNLGKVTPNFYLTINAMENDNMLKVRSTPKLSTLNGHEAKLSIGKTEYYLEEANNVIGSQNPQNIITKQYKSVRADLSLIINPIVSGDDQITLEIKVDQSDFTARISKEAPPGQVSRNFSSQIRVKNEEMILLGGLEESSASTTGSGIPLLNRIPIIKWFFSTKTRDKTKNKLNIFIKPTVIY